MHKQLFTLVAAALMIGGTVVSAQEATATVTLQTENQLLSDIAVNPQTGELLVSSLSDGVIYRVGQDGALTPALSSESVGSAGGLTIDAVNSRLLVTSSGFGGVIMNGSADGNTLTIPEGFPTPEGGFPQGFPGGGQGGFPGMDGQLPQLPEGFELPEGFSLPSSSVVAFDLSSGAEVFNTDLSGVAPTMGGLLGGLTVDSTGSVYITDSLASVVYRVDAQGAPTFLSDSQFSSDGPGISAIAYHPGGFLLVARLGDGAIYKIDLTTATVQAVQISSGPASISDLAVLEDGSVAALNVSESSVSLLTSADNWTTAQVSATTAAPEGTSALAASGAALYALHSTMIGEVQQSDSPTLPQLEYGITMLSL